MPSLPSPIGDVSFRLFSGDDDFPGMVRVVDAASEADGIDRSITVEETRQYYQHLTNCDPLTDVLVAEDPTGIVGYSRVTWRVETATNMRAMEQFGWIDPRARGRGLGTAMLEWCEDRLREIAGGTPHDGPTEFRSWYDERETEKQALLTDHGYSVSEVDAEMTRSLDEPIPDRPLPDGLRIVPKTIDDAREVFDADTEAFRDHVGFAEASEEDYQDFLTGHYSKNPSLWKVAEDGEGIAGMVLNYVDEAHNDKFGRRRGITESISTQRRWRGKGLAKALIAESMRMFKDIGMTEVALGVHTTNPTGAFQLYQGLGYEVVARSYAVRKPFD
ncbi:MAG: GNAT family N-acetyltransferase [Acidimicrobiia bacterium]